MNIDKLIPKLTRRGKRCRIANKRRRTNLETDTTDFKTY